MLTDQTHQERPQDRPLTIRDCFATCGPKGACNGAARQLWVQVRRHHREGPYMLCGQLVELSDNNGTEWFKVNTDLGTVWAEGRNVRMCSGDGRCSCEPPT